MIDNRLNPKIASPPAHVPVSSGPRCRWHRAAAPTAARADTASSSEGQTNPSRPHTLRSHPLTCSVFASSRPVCPNPGQWAGTGSDRLRPGSTGSGGGAVVPMVRTPAGRLARIGGLAGLVAITATGCSGEEVLRFGWPEAVTPQGERMAQFWTWATVTALIVGVITWTLILWPVVAHRKRGDKLPRQFQYNHFLEFFYTGIPVLVLPTGKTIRYSLRSKDVIHSFFVPEFNFKRDVFPFPEKNNQDGVFENSIDREGSFVGRCAELCGIYHSAMNFEVRALSEFRFDQYISFR